MHTRGILSFSAGTEVGTNKILPEDLWECPRGSAEMAAFIHAYVLHKYSLKINLYKTKLVLQARGVVQPTAPELIHMK